MFNERHEYVIRDIDTEVRESFLSVSKSVNEISNTIKKNLSNIDNNEYKELMDYLNTSMSTKFNILEENNINLNFYNDYNSVKQKINNHGYLYNTEKFNKSLKIRKNILNIINKNLSEENVENGINVKNGIYKEIYKDIENHKREESLIYESFDNIINKELTFK